MQRVTIHNQRSSKKGPHEGDSDYGLQFSKKGGVVGGFLPLSLAPKRNKTHSDCLVVLIPRKWGKGNTVGYPPSSFSSKKKGLTEMVAA